MRIFLIIMLMSSNAFCEDVWKEYLNFPSSINASEVVHATIIDDDYGIDILETQIISGDVEALRLAHRLKEWNKKSVAVSERLSEVIGRVSRYNPEMFVLVDLEQKVPCEGINVLGEQYVDRIHARLFEIEQCINSLSQLDRSSTKKRAKECIDLLIFNKQKLKKIVNG